MNPLAFWKRAKAIEHGFESVRMTVEQNFDQLEAVFSQYGLDMDRETARRRAERARAAQGWRGEPEESRAREDREAARPLRLVGADRG
jgi:hypothetical protein